MAKLKSLRIKDKTFIFEAYGNKELKKPCKVVFVRFPTVGELFAKVQSKGLLDGIDLTQKDSQQKAADRLVDSFMENMTNGAIDYERFVNECVDHFEEFEIDDSKVVTPQDFFQILPAEAAHFIAAELYQYATERDQFSMGE